MEAVSRLVMYKVVIVGCGRIAGRYDKPHGIGRIYSHASGYANDGRFELSGCVDKDEKKIFTNLEFESRLVAFYNRIVGYRHTERGISMLHSVMTLIIKKMLALKSKTAVKVSTSNRHVNNLSGEVSNPVHASSS